MRSRTVVFTDTARADLVEISEWLSEAASWETAVRYITRIERFCMFFDLASERGTRRDDIRPRLRIVGFEKNLSIAFEVTDDAVRILRVFRAGRDWESELLDD